MFSIETLTAAHVWAYWTNGLETLKALDRFWRSYPELQTAAERRIPCVGCLSQTDYGTAITCPAMQDNRYKRSYRRRSGVRKELIGRSKKSCIISKSQRQTV